MLQSSGSISFDDIRKELKKSGEISMNDSNVRKLAKKETGEISMKDFLGKSNISSVTFLLRHLFSKTYGQDIIYKPFLIENAETPHGKITSIFFKNLTSDYQTINIYFEKECDEDKLNCTFTCDSEKLELNMFKRGKQYTSGFLRNPALKNWINKTVKLTIT